MNIKVLGVGSPFSDDQIGWKVVETLKSMSDLQQYIPNSLTLECLDRPGLMLIDDMQFADTVIIIDAMQSGLPIGTIHRFYNEEIKSAKGFLSTHSIGVIQALELAKALDRLPGHVIVYGIEIGGVTQDFELSPEALKAKDNATGKIATDLLNLLNGEN